LKRKIIIPARGGSKRLPNKNLKILNGKPLIFYTIDAVLDSNKFHKIIFSTDDKRLIDLVESNYTQEKVFIHNRPSHLATDSSKVIETVIELIDEEYDQTWLSLPTSPLKTKYDFKQSVDLLDNSCDGVISYTDMEFPPSLGILISDEGSVIDYHESKPWQNGNTRSQDHQKVFRPNGSIYGMWSSKLKESKSFYKGKIKGYYMSRSKSIDIDSQFDFDFAEFIMKSNYS
jgi:CMP-N,N'-diacetyllegionaminic acid synthase